MSWLLAILGAAAILAAAVGLGFLGGAGRRNPAAVPPPAGRPEAADPARDVTDRLMELERLRSRGSVTSTEAARRRGDLGADGDERADRTARR